jgi:hypothetical protein
VFITFKKVFSQPQYITRAVVAMAIVFMFAVWLPNLRLIVEIMFNSNASLIKKINFLFSLFGSIQTNFSAVSASYIIAIAILFGVNVALLVYFIRNKQTSGLVSGATLSIGGGLISGVFGIGCAACGTFILSSLLGMFGSVGIVSFLPFGGEEFGFLGVGLLVYSIYIISKKINDPLVCE